MAQVTRLVTTVDRATIHYIPNLTWIRPAVGGTHARAFSPTANQKMDAVLSSYVLRYCIGPASVGDVNVLICVYACATLWYATSIDMTFICLGGNWCTFFMFFFVFGIVCSCWIELLHGYLFWDVYIWCCFLVVMNMDCAFLNWILFWRIMETGFLCKWII